ncbi:unnamed protein product [Dovyalis caffra]|uniref:Uncharacterized protein n=1 Tax=Dovyalis caffra TaxID=77055 RepID=A0AAV1RXM9_9ROSI|nr:unnamed protein product [Dovyalis caffra]
MLDWWSSDGQMQWLMVFELVKMCWSVDGRSLTEVEIRKSSELMGYWRQKDSCRILSRGGKSLSLWLRELFGLQEEICASGCRSSVAVDMDVRLTYFDAGGLGFVQEVIQNGVKVGLMRSSPMCFKYPPPVGPIISKISSGKFT